MVLPLPRCRFKRVPSAEWRRHSFFQGRRHSAEGTQIIKRGKDSWLIRVFLGRDENGKRNYANETFRGTKKKAQERLTEMLSDVNNGTFVKPQKISLNTYLNQWLEVVKPRLSERTHPDYTYLLKRYVRSTLGARILTDLSAADIQVLYAKMSDAGLSPRIVRYVHTVLSAALKKAVRLTLLRFDPTSVVELPKQTRNEIKAFSPEEAACFLDAAKEDVCLRKRSVKKARKLCSLSPLSGAPRRIAAVADEERSRPQFD